LNHTNSTTLIEALSLAAAIIHPDIRNGAVHAEYSIGICVVEQFLDL
jgi:hypothetical protein